MQLIKQEILFTPADAPRMLHIALPEGYDQSSERYPVMYFFDGHNLFDDADATYGKSWGLRAFLDRWEKPMIIVGIECSHVGNERLVEYCPYHYKGAFWGGDLFGRGKETMDFMVKTLKPMIDSRFRTYPFREATAIGGSSMGGLMSVYAAVKYNGWFSKAACLSSAVGAGMDDLLADIASSPIDADTRIYLSWGTAEAGTKPGEDPMASDWARCNIVLADALREKGANTRLFCQVGGQHCEADWEKQVPGFMDFLWMDK